MNFIVTTPVPEKGTIGFSLSFYDQTSVLVTPNSIYWHLADAAGSIINSRENVGVTPASTCDIILSGDDLQINSGSWLSKEERWLIVDANYNSDWGLGLPLKGYIKIPIENIGYLK